MLPGPEGAAAVLAEEEDAGQARHDDPAEGARQMAQAMRADLFDIDCDFYLAGPEAFVATLDAQLAAAGVPKIQRFAEVM